MSLNGWLEQSKVPHYYGDYVRLLFLFAGVIMLLNLPFFMGFLLMPPIVSIVGIIALAIVAGLTTPLRLSSMILNLFVALAGFVIFDFYTVITYNNPEYSWPFFFINMLLSLVFLIALYFSVKTLRAKMIKNPVE